MLIEACQDLEQSPGLAPHTYKRIEEVVRPWLSIRVLSQTDRDILRDLLGYCREIEEQLGGRHDLTLISLLKTFSITIAIVGFCFLLWTARDILFAAADQLQSRWVTFRLALQTLGETEAVFAGGIILTFLSIFLLSRSTRG